MPRYDHEATAALLARVPAHHTHDLRVEYAQHEDGTWDGTMLIGTLAPGEKSVIWFASVGANGDGEDDAYLFALAPDLASALALAHAEIARLRDLLADIDTRTEATRCEACADIRAMTEEIRAGRIQPAGGEA